MDSANECGHQLVSEVLDDPVVTQHDLQEMNEMWDSVCQKSVQKQERLDEALEVLLDIIMLMRLVNKQGYTLFQCA